MDADGRDFFLCDDALVSVYENPCRKNRAYDFSLTSVILVSKKCRRGDHDRRILASERFRHSLFLDVWNRNDVSALAASAMGGQVWCGRPVDRILYRGRQSCTGLV